DVAAVASDASGRTLATVDLAGGGRHPFLRAPLPGGGGRGGGGGGGGAGERGGGAGRAARGCARPGGSIWAGPAGERLRWRGNPPRTAPLIARRPAAPPSTRSGRPAQGRRGEHVGVMGVTVAGDQAGDSLTDLLGGQ